MTVVAAPSANRSVFTVMVAISLCHLLNDLMQSILPAVYPILRNEFALSFTQLGMLSFVYQVTGSLCQPFIGSYTDKNPLPYSLPLGMLASLAGILLLAYAPSYPMLLAGGTLLGLGSAIFHPEASRIARLASGGAHGLAQSVFQVGGNFGTAIGPLAAAYIILPQGRKGMAWFALAAMAASFILTALGRWYQLHMRERRRAGNSSAPARHPFLSRRQVGTAIAVLLALLFSKYIYLAAFKNYYTFFLIDKFGLTIQTAQVYQFIFFSSIAAGTVAGGVIGDRLGRKIVIWGSILGVLPFTLLLPHVGLTETAILTFIVGFVMSSAFPAIVVYGQELMPGRVGMVSGLFFGFIFGIGGIGAALLGIVADYKGVEFMFLVCSLLPVMGILAAFLPETRMPRASAAA